MDRIVSVAKSTITLYALVCQVLLAQHQIVVPNVLLVQNVHKIRHVLIRNAKIRAQAHADKMLVVKSLITIQFVPVHPIILAIHLSDAYRK